MFYNGGGSVTLQGMRSGPRKRVLSPSRFCQEFHVDSFNYGRHSQNWNGSRGRVRVRDISCRRALGCESYCVVWAKSSYIASCRYGEGLLVAHVSLWVWRGKFFDLVLLVVEVELPLKVLGFCDKVVDVYAWSDKLLEVLDVYQNSYSLFR